MITVDNIHWRWLQQPLSFNFKVQRGERLAIVGPSGAGKSTLLSLIAGFLTPNSGQMWLDGQDQAGRSPAQRPVSMLFQDNNLFTHLNVRQNIGLGLHPGLRLNARQRQAVEQIAGQMGLATLLERLPEALSGGQRQRVALARCLIRQQPILLLDEPFSALDPALRLEMLALVEEQCQLRDVTLVMVSHSLEDAARIAPRSLVVAAGSIVWDGPTATLLAGNTPAAHWLGITRTADLNAGEPLAKEHPDRPA